MSPLNICYLFLSFRLCIFFLSAAKSYADLVGRGLVDDWFQLLTHDNRQAGRLHLIIGFVTPVAPAATMVRSSKN
jgi:hypothetical protein